MACLDGVRWRCTLDLLYHGCVNRSTPIILICLFKSLFQYTSKLLLAPDSQHDIPGLPFRPSLNITRNSPPQLIDTTPCPPSNMRTQHQSSIQLPSRFHQNITLPCRLFEKHICCSPSNLLFLQRSNECGFIYDSATRYVDDYGVGTYERELCGGK